MNDEVNQKAFNVAEAAKRNEHITDEELLRDIRDTQIEIDRMTYEAEHLEKTPLSLPSARLDHMRAASRRNGIKERQRFIEKLNAILEYRHNRQKAGA